MAWLTGTHVGYRWRSTLYGRGVYLQNTGSFSASNGEAGRIGIVPPENPLSTPQNLRQPRKNR
ncbi:MAG: hypothetical protein ACPL7A_00050 [Anaerolineales bacterium]